MTPMKIHRRIHSPQQGAERGEAPVVRKKRRRITTSGGATAARVLDQQRTMQVWSIAFSVLALLVVVGFAGFWLRSHRSDSVSANSKHMPEIATAFPQIAALTEAEALSLVRRAIANRDPELVTSYMRLGESTPDEAIAFMDNLEARDGRIERVSWVGSLDLSGTPMESVLVVFAGESSRNPRLALLVPDEMGFWKMDFEAFARICRPSLKDFLEKKLEGSRVRVLISSDSYYNGPFRDEELWECYSLKAPELKEVLPDGKDSLRGYCRRESPQAKALKRILGDDAQVKRATLEIQRTPDAGPRQFEITRVLSEDWVIPATPFDERFD